MDPLLAYVDRWSVKPGERIKLMVSSAGNAPFEARFARVICGDPNPKGPGYREIAMNHPLAGSHPGRQQRVQTGSWARIPVVDLGSAQSGLSIGITLWPTTPKKGRQGLFAWTGGDVAISVFIDEHGGAAVEITAGGKTVRAATGKTMVERAWYDIAVCLDAAAGTLEIAQRPRQLHPGFDDQSETSGRATFPKLGSGRAMLAALPEGDAPAAHYNGKIERPTLWGAALGIYATIARQLGPTPRLPTAHLLACWDFALGIPTLDIADIGPHGFNGEIVNLPTRAMTGARWSAREFRWTDKPEEWAAIHFHDDDVGDVGWQTSLDIEIPRDWKSGVYAVHLKSAAGVENVPFVVRPGDHQQRERIAILQSTFTYHVYGQFLRVNRGKEIRARAEAWGAITQTPDQNPELGLSPYNYHSDGSGVSIASMFRPMVDKRVKQIHLMDPADYGSGTYWWCCDSYMHDWLDRKGFAHDTICDHDVHEEGVDVLAPYSVLICSQHPEYYSDEMLDALHAFLARGGRLIYLGGNGFYWKAVRHKTAPYALEVRRAEGGIRVWPTEPGESYHAFDGSYGGLWRRLGRSAHTLVGNGFASQATYKGHPYQATDAIMDKRVAFMREGLDNQLAPGVALGERSFMGGGAAGHELDRADVKYGTPPHALVVASAHCAFDPDFHPVNEDLLTPSFPQTRADLIRADMTFFETPAGGAVFSVGSMTFVGSLPIDNYDNLVTRMLTNVLRRFADPTKFSL